MKETIIGRFLDNFELVSMLIRRAMQIRRTAH
jgi:hypothetical protein